MITIPKIFTNKENIIGSIVLITTIAVYYILLLFEPNILFKAIIVISGKHAITFLVVLLLIPGVTSAILFYLYSKKIKKAIIIGIITNVVWILCLYGSYYS